MKISRLSLRLALCLAAFMMVAPSLDGRKVSTKVKAPKETKKTLSPRRTVTPSDGEEFDAVNDAVVFLGYDKRGNADKETFFIENGSATDIKSMEVEITYLTAAGKQIHKRHIEILEPVPAGETRKVDIKSWDLQHSYHYVNSLPSAKGSTPYTVAIHLLAFTPSDN